MVMTDLLEGMLNALTFGGGEQFWSEGVINSSFRASSHYAHTWLDITGSGILLAAWAIFSGGWVYIRIQVDGGPIFESPLQGTRPLFVPFKQSCKVSCGSPPAQNLNAVALLGDLDGSLSDMAVTAAHVYTGEHLTYTALDITGQGILLTEGLFDITQNELDAVLEVDGTKFYIDDFSLSATTVSHRWSQYFLIPFRTHLKITTNDRNVAAVYQLL